MNKDDSPLRLELTGLGQGNDAQEINPAVIELNKVYLKYEKAGQNSYALKDVSLEIKKNEKIAICGRTGSGKTTVLNSLLKFYDINQGKITFCGQNIELLSHLKLRSNIVKIFCLELY